jgi:geranylgeranyl reductase
MADRIHDVAVIGGGPCGAQAARDLAAAGVDVILIDREGRTKPCGGAIPSPAIREFDIDPAQIRARVRAARIIAPSGHSVGMEIGDIGYVGMVDRDLFDPWLRDEAQRAGAERLTASFRDLQRNDDATVTLVVEPKDAPGSEISIRARIVIGADGANSAVRRCVFGAKARPPYVFAYHEVVRAPKRSDPELYDSERCDVVYDGRVSPDFYGWVFPHGEHASVGCGSAVKGHDLKLATQALRDKAGLGEVETIRREGAPLPLKPMRRWDDGRNVVLAGDAAGVVAPSSGEGIYYAMLTGRHAAEAAAECLRTGDARALALPRKRFMKAHGRIFWVLGMMQWFWYRNDKRREKFVKMCADPDIQRLTWESYLNKQFVRRDPLAHLRVFYKDMREILGIPVKSAS